MKISDVRIRHLRVTEVIGEIEPAWDPGGRLKVQHGGGNFIEITTDEGLVGIGPDVDDRFEPFLREFLIGRDPLDIAAISPAIEYYLPGGMHYQYSGGVDVALWDIAGKAQDLPLYRLWGGDDGRIVPYAAMARLSTPEERTEQALALKDQGFRAIKLRLHHDGIARDIETVRRVREAVGDDMAIMTDANQAQSKGSWQPGVRWDFQRALDTARALEALGVYWLEEPLPRYDYDGQARLAAAVDIRIAGGENSRVLHEFEQMCQLELFDVLQPECLTLNGISDLLAIGEMAGRAGREISPHNGGARIGLIAHMHLVASWPHAPYLELIHDPPVADHRHFSAFIEGAPALSADGTIKVPGGPGLGVRIDPAMVLPD